MIFVNADVETDLQLGDMTRIDVSKCFVSKGGTAISTITVIPGLERDGIDVLTDAAAVEDEDKRYLDWQFGGDGDGDSEMIFDVDETWNLIDFEYGGAAFVGTVEPGVYDMGTLLDAIDDALQAGATGSAAGILSESVDEENRITITMDRSINLLGESGPNADKSFLKHIGFRKDKSGSVLVGKRVEYGIRIVQVSATNGVDAEATKYFYIRVYDEAGDALFSDDGALRQLESNIMRLVPPGRASFKDKHRQAQMNIIQKMNDEGMIDVFSEAYTKAAFVDKSEVKLWATYEALKEIYEDNWREDGDINYLKWRKYQGLAKEASDKALLRIDVDQDGKLDINEGVNYSYATVRRQ